MSKLMYNGERERGEKKHTMATTLDTEVIALKTQNSINPIKDPIYKLKTRIYKETRILRIKVTQSF